MAESIDIASVVAMPEADEVLKRLRKKVSTNWEQAVVEQEEYLDPTKPYCPPDWAMSIGDIPFCAFSDYNYIQGQSGNGKSFTVCIFEAVVLGAHFGELKYVGERQKPKVLHVDTEQNEGNVQMHVRRLYHMVGWEQMSDHQDQYRVMMLKEVTNPAQRWEKIIKACEEYRPDFLFVDGMLDTVKSINDEEEAAKVVTEAGSLASIMKLCFVGICHENPVSSKTALEGDTKAAGHIGSFSQRKAGMGVAAVKDNSGEKPVFVVAPRKVRNKDFGTWKFTIKDELVVIGGKGYWFGIPQWEHNTVDLSASKQKEDEDTIRFVRRAMTGIVWSQDGLGYREIQSGLQSEGITSKRKIADYITLAKNNGMIEQDPGTKKYYMLLTNETEMDTQQTIDSDPFNGGSEESKPPF